MIEQCPKTLFILACLHRQASPTPRQGYTPRRALAPPRWAIRPSCFPSATPRRVNPSPRQGTRLPPLNLLPSLTWAFCCLPRRATPDCNSPKTPFSWPKMKNYQCRKDPLPLRSLVGTSYNRKPRFLETLSWIVGEIPIFSRPREALVE